MTDFGRPAGDMYKSVYDTDDNGVVDHAETVDAHAPDHQDGGDDEIDATALVGRTNYVDRGDPQAADFGTTDFTTDGTPHTLDLSSIIPQGATVAHINLLIIDDAVATTFLLAALEHQRGYNAAVLYTNVAGMPIHTDCFIKLNADRTIQYVGANVAFALILVTVRGWFI